MTPSPIKLTDPGEWLKSQGSKPPTDPGEWLASQKPPEPTPASARFGNALWEGIGGKLAGDLVGLMSRNPADQQKSIQSIKDFVSGIAHEGPRVMQNFDAADKALSQGDFKKAAYHVAGMVPLFGAPVQNIADEIDQGKYAEAAGHTVALASPAILKGGAKLAQTEAAGTAAAAVKGAATGAAKAAVETVPLTRLGVDVQVPKVAASAAAGGAAASVMGLPRTAGAIVGGAAPIVRGAISGAKTALAERVTAAAERLKQENLAADGAKIPPDVMAELTRESNAPPVTPSPAPTPRPMPGQPIPRGQKPVAPPVEAPAPVPPEPAPVAPQPALRTPVNQQQPIVDHSQIIAQLKQARSPAEQGQIMGLPANATSQQIGEALKALMQESGTLPPPKQASSPATAPSDTALAPSMQDLPAATRKAAGKSAYRAEKGGDLPEGSGANTIIAANRANKVTPMVEALRKEGIGYVDLAQLPASELKAHVDALASASGMTEFSDKSLEQLMGELKRAEAKPNPPAKPARRAQTKAAKQ